MPFPIIGRDLVSFPQPRGDLLFVVPGLPSLRLGGGADWGSQAPCLGFPGQDEPPTLSLRGGLTQAREKRPVTRGVTTVEEKISCCCPDVRGRVEEEEETEQSRKTDRQTDTHNPGRGERGLELVPPTSAPRRRLQARRAQPPLAIFPFSPPQCLRPGCSSVASTTPHHPKTALTCKDHAPKSPLQTDRHSPNPLHPTETPTPPKSHSRQDPWKSPCTSQGTPPPHTFPCTPQSQPFSPPCARACDHTHAHVCAHTRTPEGVPPRASSFGAGGPRPQGRAWGSGW